MFQITIDNGSGPVDYTSRIGPASLTVDDSINQPTMFQFDVVNFGLDFVVPRRGAYVSITSRKYQNFLVTGFVTNDPEKEFMGLSGGKTPQAAGGLLNMTVKCTSDDWLLNVKMVPFLPAMVNQTMGQILQLLAETLAPNFYDFDVDDGDIIPLFQYDPKRKWSEIAKEFADSIRYHFWVIDRTIYFKPYGDKALGVTYDDELTNGRLNSRRISPHSLKTTPLDIPVVNDAIVVGDVEPHLIREDNFIGTGIDADFVLRHKVYGGVTQLLLEEKWDGATFRDDLWVVEDPDNRFNLAGALNIEPGTGPVSLGTAYIKGNNGLELAGHLDIDNGEIEFLDSGSGLIGGIYDDAALSLASCSAGFYVSGGASGGVMLSGGTVAAGLVSIHPVLDGIIQQPLAVGEADKHYRLQMIISAGQWSRYTKIFRTLSGVEFGGNTNEAISSITFLIEEISLDETNTTPGVIVRQTFDNTTLPAFGLYSVVNTIDLDMVLTFTQIAKPLQATLYARSLYNPVGTDLPILTPGEERHYQLGFGLQNQTATISDAQEMQLLRFYEDQVPAVGSRLRLRSWEAGRALARVRDADSIAAESVITGDDGLRSAIVTDLNPPPRTSEDAELAARAFIEDRTETQFNGSYEFPDDYFTWFTPNFNSPPVTGVLDYPRTGRYFQLNSPMRAIDDKQFVVSNVRMNVLELYQEKMVTSIEFGPDLYVPKILPKFNKHRDDILLPTDVAEEPVIQTMSEVGTTFLPDLTDLRTTGDITGNDFTVMVNNATTSALLGLSGNHIEVRRVDSGWGQTDQNLILNTTDDEFDLDRVAIEQTWYFRMVGNNDRQSRRTSAIRVVYPLVPDAPLGTLDTRDWLKPKIHLQMPGDRRNVWGVEIRSCMESEAANDTKALSINVAEGATLEVPLEMITIGKRSLSSGSTLFDDTEIYLDPDNYDGATYYFQIYSKNSNGSNPYTVTLEKTDGTVMASIELAASTGQGVYTSAAWTPDAAKTIYKLRVPQTAVDDNVIVYESRILVHQVNATKTRIQYLMHHFPGTLITTDHALAGDGRFNVTSYTLESDTLFYKKRESELATIDSWSLELAGGATTIIGSARFRIGLFNRTDNVLVTGAEVESPETFSSTGVVDVDFSNAAANFDDQDEFEIRSRMTSTLANSIYCRSALYVKLTSLSKAMVAYRMSGTNVSYARNVDPLQLSAIEYYAESTGAESAGATAYKVVTQDGSQIADSIINYDSTTNVLVRVGPFSINGTSMGATTGSGSGTLNEESTFLIAKYDET